MDQKNKAGDGAGMRELKTITDIPVGEGLVASRRRITGDHKGLPYNSEVLE